MAILKDRYFFINDIATTVVVEFVKTQKEIFGWLDDLVDNLPYDWFSTDDTFCILYKDGTEDRIDTDYDGHKIKKKNIASIVYSNDCSYVVYGHFEMNDCGVVYPAFTEKVDTENITEINHYIQ
jgi:hypothetical protein